jgi:predicted nucleic acid-binding protein
LTRASSSNVALAERRGLELVTADEALRCRLVGVDRLVAPEDLVG